MRKKILTTACLICFIFFTGCSTDDIETPYISTDNVEHPSNNGKGKPPHPPHPHGDDDQDKDKTKP